MIDAGILGEEEHVELLEGEKRTVEVLRDPDPKAGAYRSRTTLTASETLVLAFPSSRSRSNPSSTDDRRREMISRKPVVVATALLLSLGASVALRAEIPDAVDPGQIPNYRVAAPGIATAGKPSAEALSRLKAQGFKTVIDLRTEAEGTAAEKQAVEAQGLRYVSVPISVPTFSAADVDAVAKVLGDAEARPILLHCASANRVGAVWGVLQVRQGRTVEEAEAAARAIGLTSPTLTDAMRRVMAQSPR
jgi:uncharacterized protein (TIGR01244 family)